MSRFLYFFTILTHFHFAIADDYSNLGWPQTLTKLYYQLNEKPKNFFLLVSRVPSIAVDFRSPEGMRHSINSFSFQKHFHPGHEMIGWKCRIGGQRFESMLGFSGESNDQHKVLLEAGWGLSSLLATFKDGFLQDPQELEKRFQHFLEENKKAEEAGDSRRIFLAATVIEITESDCEKIVNETFEFINHPKNPVENFSMILSPYKYEGAGCGSFAVHFMEQIESIKSLIPLFRRQFDLPNYLFGTGTALPEGVEIPEKIAQVALKKPVSKFKLVTSSWTSALAPNVNVEILDPELLVYWQKLSFDAYFDRNNWTKQKKSFNKNKAIARGVWENVEDIYDSTRSNRYVAIDKNYDERTKSIYAHHSKLIESSNLTYFTFSNFPGIILEKK